MDASQKTCLLSVHTRSVLAIWDSGIARAYSAINSSKRAFELQQANISRRFLRGNGGFFYLDKPSRQGQKKTQKGDRLNEKKDYLTANCYENAEMTRLIIKISKERM
ncbi:MAG: hypothetical protein ACYS6I_04910 [Planctomycetota bacterium]